MKSMSAAEQLDQELAGLRLSEARKTAILETLKGEKPVSKKRRVVNTILIAAALCALCAFSALALSPTLRDRLAQAWGGFLPYSQTIEGVTCADQGIEIEVLSALSDDVRAQVYFAVRDVEEDRLDEWLELSGVLAAGEEKELDEDDLAVRFGTHITRNFQVVSYDPDTKSALVSADILYGETNQPNHKAGLTITGMTTQKGYMDASVSCASVAGEALESLPLSEENQVVCDLTGSEAALPSRQVVLAPNQNPMPMEGTEDMWISSMGFASDGCFHIRLEYAGGVEAVIDEYGSMFFSVITPIDGVKRDDQHINFLEVTVENGMDICFPMVTAEDLEQLAQVEFYGYYTRPGVEIAGAWNIDFELDYYPSVTLDWTGELAGRQVRQVAVSPLTVTMYSNDWGGLSTNTLYAVMKDGSTVAAAGGPGRYANVGVGTGEEVWDAYNTWYFEEPVELEDIVSLTLLEESIPLN